MKNSTKIGLRHIVQVRVQLLVVVSCLGLSLLGQVAESSWGWVSCPPRVVTLMEVGGKGKRSKGGGGKGCGCRPGWDWLVQTWGVPAGRSLMLGLLWQGSGGQGPSWGVMLPWLVWLWQQVGWAWPWLRRQPEWRLGGWLLWQGQRLAGGGDAQSAGGQPGVRDMWPQ
jgi:hypothetical protein